MSGYFSLKDSLIEFFNIILTATSDYLKQKIKKIFQ